MKKLLNLRYNNGAIALIWIKKEADQLCQPLFLIQFISLQANSYWKAHNLAVIPPLVGTLAPLLTFSLVGYGKDEG